MKKIIGLVLILCLSLAVALPALASEAMIKTTYLFAYVTDATMNTITVMTDNEKQYTFEKSDNTNIVSDDGVVIDDAVIIMYIGTLNTETQVQSVHVPEITILNTLHGTIHESTTMNVIAVQTIDEAGNPGVVYRFDKENSDIVVGEDGILIGDEVEVAFREPLSELVPENVQDFSYVHITVFGQAQSSVE